MKSVLAAKLAVFLKLKSVRVVLLVFLRVIISLLALGAYESNLDSCIISHVSGTSHFLLFDPCGITEESCVPPSSGSSVSSAHIDTTKKPTRRGRDIIPHLILLCQGLF